MSIPLVLTASKVGAYQKNQQDHGEAYLVIPKMYTSYGVHDLLTL